MRLLSPQKTEAAVDGRVIYNAQSGYLGPRERAATDTTWFDSLRVANQ